MPILRGHAEALSGLASSVCVPLGMTLDCVFMGCMWGAFVASVHCPGPLLASRLLCACRAPWFWSIHVLVIICKLCEQAGRERSLFMI